MASENKFVNAPATLEHMTRSAWNMNNRFKGTVYHGDIFPIDILPVIPGDGFGYDIDAFIRTATPPIAPFMDDVWMSIAAFYVPERLVWSKEKEFLGENTEGYGIQSPVYKPMTDSYGVINASEGNKHAIGLYTGKLANSWTTGKHTPICLNPDRAFLQVYNDWFRNENFMAPYLWDHSQTGIGSRYLATLNGANIGASSDLPKVCKKLDRYTSCLPWAQKANDVGIIIPESYLDVGAILNFSESDPDNNAPYIDIPYTYGDLINAVQNDEVMVSNPGEQFVSLLSNNTNAEYEYEKLVAKQNAFNAFNVNQLRLSFATQRLFEALARGGSKYRETIYNLFGVAINDKTAQMAEYLGGMTIKLNVDQVTQTTGYSAGTTTELGAPGAVSLSAASENIFNKSFDEPGFIVLVGYTKHQRTYGQGLKDMYRQSEFLEMYNPKFAFIGEQPIKRSTIYFTGIESLDDNSFGFQEAFSDLRFVPDVVVGDLNPAMSNSLDFWTLAEKYSAAPTLGADFLTEDRNCIARCLSGGLVSPDYFVDIKINRRAVRVMPVQSIPGAIDHF